MNARRSLPFLGMAVSALLLTSACGGGADSSTGPGGGGPVEGQDFTMALTVDPGDLDPTKSTSSAGRSIFGLAYDTLVYYRQDGSVVPGLAEKWEATENSVTFNLKKGVTCADGSPLTAKDVADNVNYIADPKNGSELLGVIVQPGTTTTSDDAANTVTVTTPKPDGLLLAELSGVFIVCRSGLDDHASLAKGTAGSGPYTLEKAMSGNEYTFVPRKDYAWGPEGQTMKGKGVPKSVVVRIIDNQTTIANLLRSGDLNYATVSGPDAARVPSNLKSIITRNTAGELWFNENAGHPAADRAVREALVTAIDRKALSDVATGGKGEPSQGLITLDPNPCSGTKSQVDLPEYDEDKANQLLDAAGWVKGSDGVREKGGKKLEFKFTYSGAGSATRVAGMELLASYWKKVGAEVKLQNLPDAQLSEDLFGTGSWDASGTPFTFNLASQLVGFVSGPASPNGANFANIRNDEYEKVVAEAVPLVGEKSCASWAKADEALVKALNPVPMFDEVVKTYYARTAITAPGLQIWGSSIRMHE